MIFSCIIPCRDRNDPQLQDLIRSIRAQDFPQGQIEILVISEGDSEQAKAIGIRRAKGSICAMFCADNEIIGRHLFGNVYHNIRTLGHSAVYTNKYAHIKTDNSLNRYFALIGGNDPVCYYLGKNDREPHVQELKRTTNYQPSFGCNGFFYDAELIKKTNLDHYYPMDNASEVDGTFVGIGLYQIHHKTTDGNLIKFLWKRYKYARDLYSDRTDRRWKMVDGRKDVWRLIYFIIASATLIEPLSVSIRGCAKHRDLAWFWHPVVCLGHLIMYGVLACRNLLKFQSVFQRPDQKVWNDSRCL